MWEDELDLLIFVITVFLLKDSDHSHHIPPLLLLVLILSCSNISDRSCIKLCKGLIVIKILHYRVKIQSVDAIQQYYQLDILYWHCSQCIKRQSTKMDCNGHQLLSISVFLSFLVVQR